MAMTASHLSPIGSDPLIDFRCASSSMLTYSVTHGSLDHQPRVAEEGAGGYGRQPFIVDWKRRPDIYFLRLLKPVNVFRYSWILGPPAEGRREEGDDVCGLEAATASLKAREEVS